MSNWTHVCGNLWLGTSVYDWDKKNDPIIPNPREQIKIYSPACRENWRGNDEMGLGFTAEISSLPRVKNMLETAIKDILPSGEYDVIQHKIYNIEGSCDGSSNRGYAQEEQEIQKKIVQSYQDPWLGDEQTWDQLVEYQNAFIDSIQYNMGFCIAFNADIRNCSARDFADTFTKFIRTLLDNDIYFDLSTMRWEDEYHNEYYYQFNHVDSARTPDVISIHNAETSTILAKREIKKLFSNDGNTEIVQVIDSDNWGDF